MTENAAPSSAKDRVLGWVRSKNPQTMELKFGCKVRRINDERIGIVRSRSECHIGNKAGEVNWIATDDVDEHGQTNGDWFFDERNVEILGSDMGLQEIANAFKQHFGEKQTWMAMHENAEVTCPHWLWFMAKVMVGFDLTQNLHSQSDEFYQALLPLING